MEPVENHLDRTNPLGWVWAGVLHLYSGVTLEQLETGDVLHFEFMGKVIDSEGNVLKEATPLPDDWDDD